MCGSKSRKDLPDLSDFFILVNLAQKWNTYTFLKKHHQTVRASEWNDKEYLSLPMVQLVVKWGSMVAVSSCGAHWS